MECQAWLPIPDSPWGSCMITLPSSTLGLSTRRTCLLWYCLATRTQIPMGQRAKRKSASPIGGTPTAPPPTPRSSVGPSRA